MRNLLFNVVLRADTDKDCRINRYIVLIFMLIVLLFVAHFNLSHSWILISLFLVLLPKHILSHNLFHLVAMGGSPYTADLELATIFFGLFLSLFFFVTVRIFDQSLSIWKRTHDIWNAYLWMIWIEAIVNFTFAGTTYLFIREVLPPR